jgi:hypothetical protein
MLETVNQRPTIFGSLAGFQKGEIQLVTGSAKEYAFSNIFEVASQAKPYEKTVVGKNLEYVMEAIRAEGTSPWYACSHDEFVICMDGEVRVEFVKLVDPGSVTSPDVEGTVAVKGEPAGRRMGHVVLHRGHQALLPHGAAYRFVAGEPSVLLQQTIFGKLSVERWGEICYR